MKKWFGLLIIICIFLSGCNESENSKKEGDDSYEVVEYTLPYFPYICAPVLVDKNIYYLEEKAEYSYLIGKMDISTGETDERELDLAEKYNIMSFSVDSEENSYYLITVEEGEQIWNKYFIKLARNGELVYKQPYSNETLNAVGLLLQVKVEGEEVSISGSQGKVVVDEQGGILSVKQGMEEEEEGNLVAFQGSMYHINKNGKDAERLEKLFDLIDYGIEYDSLNNVVQYDDGVIVGWSEPNVNIGYKVLVFTPSPKAVQQPSTADTELTMAVLEADSMIKAAVVDFNKSQKDINIVIKEYGAGGKSIEDAYAELNAGIVAGNGPDMIALKPGENHYTLVESGALENLQGYVDDSELIKEEDYIKSAWDIGKCGDVLFGIPTEFSIQTVAAKSSIIGEKRGMDFAGVRSLHENNPDMALLVEESKMNVFSLCISFQALEFIDYENKTADFDKEEFYELLAFADTFPEAARSDNREVLLHEYYLYSIDTFLQVYEDLGTKQVTFAGYPTADGGVGIYINQGNYMYGICSRSKHKEECWKFIESYISKHCEREIPMQFSARKDILEKQFTQEFAEHESELEGFQLEEVKAAFEAVCEQSGYTQRWDEPCAEILLEELQPFFAGEKDAKQTAEIIQNRVQTYLNENATHICTTAGDN